ncbi:MAG: leucine-rich repeat domain-containing protein [Clostridia bacterium]|nr:leucine-rich repeat domain-containing protein [Clostridia bacterium]
MKKIGNYAFCYCRRSMYEVTIEEGVEEIGERAFCESYDSLTIINIPVSVKSFGRYMLAWSDELETINYAGTIAQWNEIKKYEYWGRTGERFTVRCSDGNINYSGQQEY